LPSPDVWSYIAKSNFPAVIIGYWSESRISRIFTFHETDNETNLPYRRKGVTPEGVEHCGVTSHDLKKSELMLLTP
jgi:hypothetical protein